MDALDASTGDVIEIKGKRRTVAKCLPLYPSDEGRGIVRIDGLIRNNAGVAIGDVVVVKKVKAPPAEKVVVAPLEAVPPIDERYLADALESVPVTKGDNIMIPYFGGRLTFQVVGVSPAADAALITQRTVFVISEKGEALRGVPQVTYEDIGGLKDEIQKVREMIELPLRHPEIFEKLGVEAPKGVLLYGPPGTGKTLLAKAVATESNAHFIPISGPEIMSKFYGESEARLREIFKEAKEKAPTIIFIDEIDSIAPKREEVTGEVERRVVSQLLSLMDGLEARGKVIVIAATNRPNAIDPALRRPGRFDREIEIKVPDKKGRYEILLIHTRNMPLLQDVDVEKLAAISHGFVGADLEYLCKEAAMKSEANFISVRGPELLSKWVGESERGVREVFRRARQAAPCIIFFDEIDSIAPVRGADGGGMVAERVVSQLLTELDGIQSLRGVVVLAATNRIDIVDSALLRAGRFDKVIIIPMPDKGARREVLKIHMKGKPIAKDVDVETLVELTEGFSGADIAAIVNTAVSLVLQEFLSRYPKPEEAKKHADEAIVTPEHFTSAVKKVRSSREGKPMEKVTVPYYR